MDRIDQYRAELRALAATRWPAYLREHSGLPGPRGNIELAQAVADTGDQSRFDEFIATDDEYLVFCGVVGLGRLLAEGAGAEVERRLRGHAADQRWRVREAVAMALQRLGDADLPRLLEVVTRWAGDENPLVQRAAAAGVCEPRLLASPDAAACAIEVCARATKALAARPLDQRGNADVRTLRQGLGYCWSVAVAADPAAGLPAFRSLATGDDPDVAWIVRENTKKARLAKLL
ncbi:HEAT repeat domain-containing protein [Nonomuraea basaltis]|uniref:HEAT repeat domain-containing protein n=1 Tax=Nonomuraea basaltis TaxID=2495887 RepID=UPI00110C4C88|nr:HEAT repeat domain-containing protein [Nonomuraea basaltis]TMR89108.1 HEAT repeat domain-containing protein [Nonomuraea basaltis]